MLTKHCHVDLWKEKLQARTNFRKYAHFTKYLLTAKNKLLKMIAHNFPRKKIIKWEIILSELWWVFFAYWVVLGGTQSFK